MYDIDDKLKKLPDKPGVYLMYKNSDIIYVGKAVSLKNRVRQYFQSSGNKDLKVRSMVKNITDFEYIIVDNEVEALILESNLIKKHKPRYNILLKDDKQYPYIKLTMKERFPRVMKTREILKDGAKYFGPYPSISSVNDILDIIREIYPIRNCNRNLESGKSDKRPCLNYFIGRCMGPCTGRVRDQDYDNMVQEILIFLDGREDALIDVIRDKMLTASQALNYEEAARYRDQIQSIETLKEKQKIISTSHTIDQDIIGMAEGIDEVCIQIFFLRQGKIIGREHFFIENTFKEDKKAVLASFIKQFYSGTAYIPKEILIEEEVDETQAIEQWLSNMKASKVSLLVPKIGEKRRLVEMVKTNARDMVDKYGDRFLRKARENERALEELRASMKLDNKLDRIEAFDISNISGAQAVGSMVVFEKGEAKKSDYRRFRIRSTVGPDDYKSMEEVLSRRFRRGLEERQKVQDRDLELEGFSNFPDLIMMDGGKGQVNIAKRVLFDLGIDIPVCGLVKDESHTTRGIIYNNKEISLREDSLGFRMIYRIQEEAHRFAINYHRSLRSKDMFRSELDGIEHIGPKRKKDLLAYFKSIEKIKNATREELLEVESMNNLAAESLINHFKKGV